MPGNEMWGLNPNCVNTLEGNTYAKSNALAAMTGKNTWNTGSGALPKCESLTGPFAGILG